MTRFIPWQLEPDLAIREQRMIEAEREFCRIAGVIHPEDLPTHFECHAGNERRRRNVPVAHDRRVIWPNGRRFNRGEVDGSFCRVNTDSHGGSECADQALGSSDHELGDGPFNHTNEGVIA